jgi:hypothetical protein
MFGLRQSEMEIGRHEDALDDLSLSRIG